MNIQYRLDTSGNLLISPDTATTSAKHVALTLLACASLVGHTVEGVNDSPITGVAYDSVTHTLSWQEQGQTGTQSVTINNPTLVGLLSSILTDHQAATSTEAITTAVVEAIPTADEIAEAVASKLDLSVALDGVSTSIVGEVANSVVPRIKTLDAKVDTLIERGTRRKPESSAPDYLQGGK